MEILLELLKTDQNEPFTGYFYPREVVVRAVDSFDKRIRANECIPGEYTPPHSDNANLINFKKVSHMVKHVWLEANTVVAKVKLLGHYAEMAQAGWHFQGFVRDFVQIDDEKRVTLSNIVTIDLRYEEKEVQ